MATQSVSPRWRALSLVLIGLVAGTLLLGTAGAHVGTPGHLWRTHIKPKVKKLGDNRWINNNEKAADSDLLDGVDSGDFADAAHAHSGADITSGTVSEARIAASLARDAEVFGIVQANDGPGSGLNADLLDDKDSSAFVENQGTMSMSVMGPWVETDAAISGTSPAISNTFSGTKTGTVVFSLFPELPSSLYGKRVRLTGLELCYNATQAAVTLSDVELVAWSSTDPFGLTGGFVVDDGTNRNDAVCRSSWAGIGSPRVMGTNSLVELTVDVDWNGTGGFSIQRTTLFFEPTGTAAGPASPSGSLRLRPGQE